MMAGLNAFRRSGLGGFAISHRPKECELDWVNTAGTRSTFRIAAGDPHLVGTLLETVADSELLVGELCVVTYVADRPELATACAEEFESARRTNCCLPDPAPGASHRVVAIHPPVNTVPRSYVMSRMNKKSRAIPTLPPMYDSRLNPGSVLRRTGDPLPDGELGFIRAGGYEFHGFLRRGVVYDAKGRRVRIPGGAVEAHRAKVVQTLRSTDSGGLALDDQAPWACQLESCASDAAACTETFRVVSSGRFIKHTRIVCSSKDESAIGELGVYWLDGMPVLGTLHADHFMAVAHVRLRLDDAMPVWKVIDAKGPAD